MRLGELKPPPGARRKTKRLGLGTGSGTGKTAGKGHKGQRARSGATRGSRANFEGGQNPIHRRLPKFGFSNEPFRKTFQVVNLGAIEARGLEGEVGPEELAQAGLIKKVDRPVKILGEGELTRSLAVKAHKFSRSALEKIAQGGGTAEVI